MNNTDELDFYTILQRGGGVVIAIALWFISMRFSVDGFQIASEEDMWVGVVLGLTVTYLQIMFNHGAPNKTLYFAGVVAYTYGLATNLIGIMAIRGNAFTWNFISVDPVGFFLQLTIVVTIALAVEVLPEHLAIHSFRPGKDNGDFIDSLFKGMPKGKPGQNNQQRRPNQQKDNRPNRQKQQKQHRPTPAPGILDGIRGRGHREIPTNRGERRGNVTIMNGDEHGN